MEKEIRFFTKIGSNGRCISKYGVLCDGKVLLKPTFSSACGFEDLRDEDDGIGDLTNFGFVRKGKKWGLINRSLEEVIPIKFDTIIIIGEQHGQIQVVLDGKCGLYNFKGECVLPLEYDEIENGCNIAKARKGDKWSYFKFKGCIATQMSEKDYNERTIFSLSNGTQASLVEEKVRFNKLIEKYDVVYGSQWDSMRVVKIGRKFGCVNKQGEEIIPLIYQKIKLYKQSQCMSVKLKNRYGYFDYDGQQITPLIYDSAEAYENGVAIVSRDNKYGAIDRDGVEIIPLKYSTLKSFDCETSSYFVDGKYGLINNQGEEITPPIYDYIWLQTVSNSYGQRTDTVEAIHNEYAVVKRNNKYGLVSRSGEELTPLIYDDVKMYLFDYVTVSIGKKRGLIDRLGREIIPLKYSDIYTDHPGTDFLAAKYRGKWAIVNKKGERVTPFVIDEFKDKFVRIGKKWFIANDNGMVCDKHLGGYYTYIMRPSNSDKIWEKIK